MEVQGNDTNISCIQQLPEDCLSRAISLTSPRDSCRSEEVSTAFRSAATSDDVWKCFLPANYEEILARAVYPVDFSSLKQLYFRLCDPILIDGGSMGFSLDRETGAKCFILSAKELGIVWGDTEQYWSWMHDPDSRFSEVAELRNVCWLEIRGRISSRQLSKRTNYAAYLIFKLSNTATGLRHPLQEGSVSIGAHLSKNTVCLMESEDSYWSPPIWPFWRRPRISANIFQHHPTFAREPAEDLGEPIGGDDAVAERQEDNTEEEEEEPERSVVREAREMERDEAEMERNTVGKPNKRCDGWMEIMLGEFYNEEGDDGEVDISLMEVKGGNWKQGLTVQGIEIRPKK